MTAQEVFVEIKKTRYKQAEAWLNGDIDAIKSTARYGSFWARTKNTIRVHVPIAADLLFGETPSVYASDASDQPRLEKIMSVNNLFERLRDSARICSALGDVYIKLNWDKDLSDVPIISFVSPALALPEYEQGLLRAVCFMSESKSDLKTRRVERVFERYARGEILTERYIGTPQTLGALTEQTSADTGIDEVLCVHIKNGGMIAGDCGQSDYVGVYDLFDALDEVYSSSIRDVSLGKARIIVPTEFLKVKNDDPLNQGRAVYNFDNEEEVYVGLDIQSNDGQSPITTVQSAIRANEHRVIYNDLLERIVTAAGYSPQSFGLNTVGYGDSGTALSIRERKTYITKARKELSFKSKIERLLWLALQVDDIVFGAGNKSESVSLEIKDYTGDTTQAAQTVAALSNADAISDYTKIQMVHPDWSDEQIREEVALIRGKNGGKAE